MIRRTMAVLAGLLLVAVAPRPLRAQKTDTLTMINGDRIIGEIKSVYRGKLDYSTDDVGRLSIEWIKVSRLTSRRYYEIVDRWGLRHFGPLVAAAGEGLLAIDGVQRDTLRIIDVVEVVELGARITKRLKGLFDLGFTYTKANNASTLSARTEIEYRGPRIGSTIELDGYQADQDGADPISRHSGKLGASYFLPDRWSIESAVSAERNDELDLDLRLVGGGGVGRTLMESNRASVEAVGGLVVTQEKFSVDTAAGVNNTSVEASFGLQAETFKFDKPKLSVIGKLSVFPSLTTPGRVRGGASFETQYTSMKDLTFGVRFTDTFDSRPPAEGAQKNDFNFTLSVGWTYRR